MKPLYIYNLFPKLYKNTKSWEKAIPKITKMGFNSIYINPFHYPGFSGSLYSPKDFYEYHPDFFTKSKEPEAQLKDFLNKCKEKNLEVFMDLVINHTAFDSVLLEQHKDWFILDENGDIKKPGAWEDGEFITWGDLATLDFENSKDKGNLWRYMLDLCFFYIDMGFTGFRCDAAYQIPEEFWSYLIPKVKEKYPDVFFLAETLGCTPVQIQALSNCGFDYIFNSSKWWNFNDSWCLEQYSMTREIAPSISFPETHDTDRLLEEVGGHIPAFLQRLYFEAIFSKGFMITSGFEYGFRKRLNTVETKPDDWEETGHDFTSNIKNILKTKDNLEPLHNESPIEIVDQANWMSIFSLVKEWENKRVLIILNKDAYNPQHIYLDNVESIIREVNIKDYSPDNNIQGDIKKLDIDLNPGELKILSSSKYFKPSKS